MASPYRRKTTNPADTDTTDAAGPSNPLQPCIRDWGDAIEASPGKCKVDVVDEDCSDAPNDTDVAAASTDSILPTRLRERSVIDHIAFCNIALPVCPYLYSSLFLAIFSYIPIS